jgi:hypothetical protein
MLAESVFRLTRFALEHVAAACPSCPTQQAAREIFFTDDPLPRLGGMLGPFVVTAMLVGLLFSKLKARQWREDRDPLASVEEESHDPR